MFKSWKHKGLKTFFIGISAEMAIRLSKLLKNTDVVMWMNLQRDYDIWVATQSSKKIRVIALKKAA